MVFPIESNLWVEEIIIIIYHNSMIRLTGSIHQRRTYYVPTMLFFIPINRVKLVGCLLL